MATGQGTIKTYNPQSRSGLIVDDAKNELAFDGDSFSDTGMREFRLGQRVKYFVEGDPPRQKVRHLTIVSL